MTTPNKFWTVFWLETSKVRMGDGAKSYTFAQNATYTENDERCDMLELVNRWAAASLTVLETRHTAEGYVTRDVTVEIVDEANEFAFNSMSPADQDGAREYDKWKEFRE